jgi:hypothetical protein
LGESLIALQTPRPVRRLCVIGRVADGACGICGGFARPAAHRPDHTILDRASTGGDAGACDLRATAGDIDDTGAECLATARTGRGDAGAIR